MDQAVPETDDYASVVEILAPDKQCLPVVLASPHSGRAYSDAFLAAARLDPLALRQSEDGYVDEIFGMAARLGVPLLKALYPRAFVDANREAFELDPAMFRERLPDYVNSRSPRVMAGLGTIARVVAQGQEIYRDKLALGEAMRRIEHCYWPYHNALASLLDETVDLFGYCILLDCHSMPSTGDTGSQRHVDFVLGDCHGSACSKSLIDAAQVWLAERGYVVVRNAPYAGGYTTRHYGRPVAGIHAMQIEINRALYMDEVNMARKPFLAALRDQMAELVDALGRLDSRRLLPT